MSPIPRFPRVPAKWLLTAGLCAGVSIPSFGQAVVRSVKILGGKDTVEIEVEASDRITPQSQVVTGPDRLVVDFPNSRPGDGVRNQSVDRGEVKDVRVGLFQSKPPVTRLVIDLKSAQSYQVFPNGRTVMIKVVGGAVASPPAPAPVNSVPQPDARPGLVAASYTSHPEPVHIEEAPQPPLLVSYQNGMLGIHSDKATLSEVLYLVQKRTGADIAIPAGAEQERVAADLGPAPAPEVLAQLLNGSKFNFLILNAANDPSKLDRVILSTRTEGNFVAPLPPAQNNDDSGSDDEEPPPVRNQPDANNPNPPQVPPQAEQQQQQRPEPDQGTPEQ